MKYFALTAAALILCTNCATLRTSGEEQVSTELPPYSILERDGKVEVRRYDSYIVAETTVQGDFRAVGNEGFRRLYRYISGSNRSKESIAMTAPVTQEAGNHTARPDGSEKIAMTAPVGQEKSGKEWRITFMMPAKYTMETLPEPLDSRVALKVVPGHTAVAIRYSGGWRQGRYEKHLARLRQWMNTRGLPSKSDPLWARYDPPFKPWFLRRNEILIRMEEPTGIRETSSQPSQTVAG